MAGGGFGGGFGPGFGPGFGTSSGSDTTPDAFMLGHRTGMPVDTLIESQPVTITGIDAAAAWSIVDGEVSINGAAYESAGGTVENGDTVRVRVTSHADPGETVTATLTIGGVDGVFLVTTAQSGVVSIFPQKGGGMGLPRGASRSAWGWYHARQKNRARRREAQGG